MNIEKIKEFLLNNLEEIKNIIEEVNNWNGSLVGFEVFDNNEYFFNDIFYGSKYELVEKIANGSYSIEDDLVRFDCYGDIESLNRREYEEELKENIDEIIEELIGCYDDLTYYYKELNISDELKKIIEE
jgi:hypothetical protein